MAKKAIDKSYLLQALKNFNTKILSSLYQRKYIVGDGIEVTTDPTTGDETIATEVPLSVVDGMICVTYNN
jgi:hypothetical protein